MYEAPFRLKITWPNSVLLLEHTFWQHYKLSGYCKHDKVAVPQLKKLEVVSVQQQIRDAHCYSLVEVAGRVQI